MAGAITILKLKGVQDQHLTKMPVINFIKSETKQYTAHSIDTVKVEFTQNVTFGKKITCIMSNRADYLNSINFCFTLPALQKTSGTFACWTQNVGHALIEYVELQIGDRIIDKHYGIFLDIWEELTGKNQSFNQMIGKVQNTYSLKYNADLPSSYAVPFKFWFCGDISRSLPIYALKYHKVKITIKLREFDQCINYDGTTPPSAVDMRDAFLMANYIYSADNPGLNPETGKISLLITQTQYKDTNGEQSGSVFKSRVPFNHPVKELLWVFVSKTSTENNDHFNYSQRNSTPLTRVESLMKNITFYLEGAEYSRTYQDFVYSKINTMQYHTNATDRHVYSFPFCDKPEDHQPSGTLNFSVVDDFVMSGEMRSPVEDYILHIFGINYNWLEINEGISHIKYLL